MGQRKGYKESPEHVAKKARAHQKYAAPSKTMREYKVWSNMIARCENPANDDWPNYGGRGITIASAWRQSFQQFLDDMGPCPQGLTLDRIDNDGPYAPGNCRWTDQTTQSHNSRRVHLLTVDGITLPLAEWARRVGVPAARLSLRLRSGWSLERALDPTPGTPGPATGYTQTPEHIANHAAAIRARRRR